MSTKYVVEKYVVDHACPIPDEINIDDNGAVVDNFTKEPNKDYTCNMCGLSCTLREEPYHASGGFINLRVSGGYESTPGNGNGTLDDLDQYTFSMCEWCIDNMFQQFKIPPRVQSYNCDTTEQYVPAQERVLNESWRTFKKEFFDEYKKRHIARNTR